MILLIPSIIAAKFKVDYDKAVAKRLAFAALINRNYV